MDEVERVGKSRRPLPTVESAQTKTGACGAGLCFVSEF